MEVDVEKIIEGIKEFPTDWIKGFGKVRGSITTRRRASNCYRLVITDKNKKTVFTANIPFNDEDEHEKYKLVVQTRYDECWKRGLIKNRIRFVTRDTIEVDMDGHDQIMLTDAKYIDYIQKYVIYAHVGRSKHKSYYATVSQGVDEQGKPKHELFHRYVCGGVINDHINRNTMDNRECNLRQADHYVNNNNKTYTSYETIHNEVGFRGVRFDSRCDSYIAKIGTKKYQIGDGKEVKRQKVFTKSFSVKQFGDEEAKRQAIKYRKHMEEEFNKGNFNAFITETQIKNSKEGKSRKTKVETS